MKLICSLVYFVVLMTICNSDQMYSDEEDLDAIINYLLNGESFETDLMSGDGDETEPVFNGGVWKCGNCDNIDENRLIYSEVNEVADSTNDQSVDIQVAVSMSNMKCVTIHASTSGVVKRMTGACSGPTVTLTVLPAQMFTLQVYGE